MTAGTWTCPLEPEGNGLCHSCATSPDRRCDGAGLTAEILADPAALAEIASAREEIARGDCIQGVDAMHALLASRSDGSVSLSR